MDISSLTGLNFNTDYANTATQNTLLDEKMEGSFESVLSAAMNVLSDTNELQNDAEAAQMQFALGEADNPHDMLIASSKALTAVQYTTAVKNKMVEAYKEIMNMQI